MLTTAQVRDLLKTRQHLRRAGFTPSHPAVVAIQEMVGAYRAEVGTPTYLSEMLGPLAVLPVSAARFYGPAGEMMEYQGSERVIDFLKTAARLPWVVEVDGRLRYL